MTLIAFFLIRNVLAQKMLRQDLAVSLLSFRLPDCAVKGIASHLFKCDCRGFEKCSINTCGRFLPTSTALPSRSIEFQCTYDAKSSTCRTKTGLTETVKAAESAEQATISYIHESADGESGINDIIAHITKLEDERFQALKKVEELEGAVTAEELAGLTEKVDDVVGKALK